MEGSAERSRRAVPEAFTVFRKNVKSKWNADFASIRTRYSEAPTSLTLPRDFMVC